MTINKVIYKKKKGVGKTTPSSKTNKTQTRQASHLMPLYERSIKGKTRKLSIGCEILFYSIIPSKYTTSKWQNAPKFYFDYANYHNKHSDCGNRIIYIPTSSYQNVQQYIPLFSIYPVGLIKIIIHTWLQPHCTRIQHLLSSRFQNTDLLHPYCR